MSSLSELNPENAYVFRITHIKNPPWILEHGLHCLNAPIKDPDFVQIGNVDLIAKRKERLVPVAPGGTLSDYVPFYFTPCSPMLYNIRTGYNGVPKRSMEEIVLLVASLRKLAEARKAVLFTDRHAYLQSAKFYSNLEDLTSLCWEFWQNRDFSRDVENPEKFELYQAEALVLKHLAMSDLLGIACSTNDQQGIVEGHVARHNLQVFVSTKPQWFF
jgi:hypothetical protein